MKILIFAFALIMTTNVFSQQPPLETGVAQTLAKWRAANYSDVRYKLNITLEKGAPLMKGNIEIRVTLNEQGAKNDLILDWRTTQFANDKDKPFADVLQVNDAVVKKIPDSGNFVYLIDKEHIVISQRLLKTGENVIKIEFASPIKTSGAAITRYIDKEDGGEYLYSLFVPSDASTAFPCFDQPDLKAKFKLIVTNPKDWKVVSNEPVKYIITGTSKNNKKDSEDSYGFEFEETKSISTYVFAFAAGDFAEFEDKDAKFIDPATRELKIKNESSDKISSSDKTTDKTAKTFTKIYVRKSQAEKFKQHAAEVFRLNREAVKYLENYFDYKYPFPKYDFVLIPEFPFGGMEHAGATFLKESSVIFPTEPTKNDYISRATLIFHETAHQWFGDCVTMKWFDDLWLKEGFAEFMAYKTLEKVMPEYNAWKIFYERNKQAAYLTDSTKGTTPIYQEISNLSAAKSAYGNIVYRKAPSFLRQAEFYLGEDKFQIAVRQFLKKHEFANAEWTDLVKEFEDVAWFSSMAFYHSSDAENVTKEAEEARRKYIRDWADSWIKQAGVPIIKVIANQNKNTLDKEFDILSFEIKEINSENPRWKQNTQMYVQINGATPSIFNRSIPPGWGEAQTLSPVTFQKIPPNAKTLIFPNYQDYGYGIFLLDEQSRAYVLANIQNEKDDFLRAMMWGSLWDSVRETELAPKDYVELVIKNINVETDESTISTLLGRVSTAMNYYLSDAQRAELAPRLEKAIGEKMFGANTPGQRLTFYRAFLNVASTAKAAEVLKTLLKVNSEATPEEMKYFRENLDQNKGQFIQMSMPVLRTKDKFDIVTKLLILGDEDAPKLLAELEKTEKSDDAKRYAYAAKAGIGTPENKSKYWKDFIGNQDISESYIEAAFAPFNSIRHSELTLPFLEEALAELPNLKKNRKIFFVGGWLGAFIGGQKSERALEIVNKFLADNPNLDKDLRLKILENADGLERAVKIRARYGK